MKPHKTKQTALAAARKALGENAVEGIDFNLRNTGAGWTHEPIEPGNAAAAKSQAKRKAAPAKPKKAKGLSVEEIAQRTDLPKTTVRKSLKSLEAKGLVQKVSAPEGQTKSEMLLGMLNSAGGATSKEMEAATGWQPHSVRGMLGTLKKKGVNVVAKKLPGEPTIYRIAAPAPVEPVGDVI